MTTHRSGFLPAPIRMTLNARFIDSVRLMDVTLGVRLLPVSDSTICMAVARGGGVGGLEGLAPTPHVGS